MKRKWYVVWVGRQAGVFSTWQECAAQVHGYPGAQYKAFDSQKAAEEAFQGTYEDYLGTGKAGPSPERREAVGLPLLDSYSVDASELARMQGLFARPAFCRVRGPANRRHLVSL